MKTSSPCAIPATPEGTDGALLEKGGSRNSSILSPTRWLAPVRTRCQVATFELRRDAQQWFKCPLQRQRQPCRRGNHLPRVRRREPSQGERRGVDLEVGKVENGDPAPGGEKRGLMECGLTLASSRRRQHLLAGHGEPPGTSSWRGYRVGQWDQQLQLHING